jgi:hypothetical protein
MGLTLLLLYTISCSLVDTYVKAIRRNILAASSGQTYTLKLETACFYETLVLIYQSARRHNPENRNIDTQYFDNIKYHFGMHIHIYGPCTIPDVCGPAHCSNLFTLRV